jgi:hypothetical protein
MGERRKHSPFPGTQQTIWQSSLRGMEQPVRSFKSFIRTAPPHPGSNSEKPLPPVPVSREQWNRSINPPSPTRASFQSCSTNFWKSPAAWDEPQTTAQEIQISPFFDTRTYAPLIPEPSPGDDSEETSPWPIKLNSERQSYLKCIIEQDDCTPSWSPGSASHEAPLHRPLSEAERNSRVATPDITTPATETTFKVVPSLLPPENTSRAFRSQETVSSPSVQSHEDLQPVDELGLAQPEISDGFQSTLLLRGKGLQQLPQESSTIQEMAIDIDMEEKLHELSFSQDYHNVLADQYHEAHADAFYSLYGGPEHEGPSRRPVAATIGTQTKRRQLVPRPLSWKKNPSSTSLEGNFPNMNDDANSLPKRTKRYRKVADWMPFHHSSRTHRHTGLDEDHSESVSRSATSFHNEIHLSNLIPHMKGVRSNFHRTGMADTTVAGRISPSSPHRPNSPYVSPRLEHPTPLFRLPGGLTLVRQSPTPTQMSREAGFLDISLPLNRPQLTANDPYPGPDINPVKKRLSSLYSQGSDKPVVPAIPPKRIRSSLNSSHSRRSQSHTSSSPTSPRAHEISFPRTPPPVPRNPHPSPIRAPVPPASVATADDEREDSAAEDESDRPGLHILDRARDVRQAWKKHHKDAKHEKLKKSIRVIGPTDSTGADGYAKRQNVSKDVDRVHGTRMPGYMNGGFM